MTEKERFDFNKMRRVLREISKDFMTVSQIEKATKNHVLGFQEYISLSYENIQLRAAQAVKGVREK